MGRPVSDELLRVGVIGARGRMGAQTCQAVVEAEDMDLVAAVGGREWLFSLSDAGSQVVVEFTHPEVVMDHIRFCIDQNIHIVTGTSGFTDERLDTVQQWLSAKPELGVLVVPNFAIGAVLTARFAREAAGSSSRWKSSNCTTPARSTPRPVPRWRPPEPSDWPVGTRASAQCPMPPLWRPAAPGAPAWTGSGCTPCGCRAWSRIRRSSWAAPGRP